MRGKSERGLIEFGNGYLTDENANLLQKRTTANEPDCPIRRSVVAYAQSKSGAQGQGNAQNAAPKTPRSAAPKDLTGYWVSEVTELWRFRMLVRTKVTIRLFR